MMMTMMMKMMTNENYDNDYDYNDDVLPCQIGDSGREDKVVEDKNYDNDNDDDYNDDDNDVQPCEIGYGGREDKGVKADQRITGHRKVSHLKHLDRKMQKISIDD